MSTEKKVVLITGASQGIGAGIVEGFFEKGYAIVANSRSIVEAERDDFISVSGDIGRVETAEKIVAVALKKFGRIDTLVNNAGIFIGRPFVDYSLDDFRAVMATNVDGFFHLTQRVARTMLDRGKGHIVTITTSLVDQPMKEAPALMAALSKGGLNGATRSLAIEFAHRGVRVNAVSPGIIATPMHKESDHPFLASLHPMARLGKVKEVVEAVLYLEDAAFVTGEIVHVDGGAHAGQW